MLSRHIGPARSLIFWQNKILESNLKHYFAYFPIDDLQNVADSEVSYNFFNWL